MERAFQETGSSITATPFKGSRIHARAGDAALAGKIPGQQFRDIAIAVEIINIGGQQAVQPRIDAGGTGIDTSSGIRLWFASRAMSSLSATSLPLRSGETPMRT